MQNKFSNLSNWNFLLVAFFIIYQLFQAEQYCKSDIFPNSKAFFNFPIDLFFPQLFHVYKKFTFVHFLVKLFLPINFWYNFFFCIFIQLFDKKKYCWFFVRWSVNWLDVKKAIKLSRKNKLFFCLPKFDWKYNFLLIVKFAWQQWKVHFLCGLKLNTIRKLNLTRAIFDELS